MRAKQFIFEYNQAKTAEVFGDKLLAALAADKGHVPTDIGNSRAYIVQKTKIGTPIEPEARARILSALLMIIEQGDPTPNKSYVPWLVRCYANEGVKLEDITSKAYDWLEIYTKMKLKKIIPGVSRDANIMNFIFDDLFSVITDPEYQEKMQTAEQAAMPKGDAKEVINTDQVRVIIPVDEPAACYYGQGTQWCTSGRNNNQFNNYNNRGRMYIFLPKKPEYEGEKYQIHPATGSFMNEQDEPVDAAFLLSSRFGDLAQWFKWNDPDIKKMIAFADDEVLDKIISDVKEISYEYLNGKVDDWYENNYDYYYQGMIDDGFVDENGDVDFEKAPSYLDWDYDAKEEYDRLLGLVNITSTELKQAIPGYIEETDTSPVLEDYDNLLAYMISSNRGRYGNLESNDSFADWILHNVAVDKHGQVTRVSVSRTGKVTPR